MNFNLQDGFQVMDLRKDLLFNSKQFIDYVAEFNKKNMVETLA